MSKHIILLALSILLISASVVFSNSSLAFKPLVANVHLGGASQNKQSIYASNDSVTFTILVVTSADVSNTATAKVDFLDYSNPMHVGYSISPTTRTQTKDINWRRPIHRVYFHNDHERQQFKYRNDLFSI